MTHEEIIAAVESMTVLELADLVKAMDPLLAPLLPLRKKRPSSTWC